MAWLIMRIEPAENDTLPEHISSPIVEQIATRVQSGFEAAGRGQQNSAEAIISILADHGYETMEDWPVSRAPRTEWPLTAYTYVSQRKDGVGRSWSTLKRIPVRKK